MPFRTYRSRRDRPKREEFFTSMPSSRSKTARSTFSWTNSGSHGTSRRMHEHHCRQAEYEQRTCGSRGMSEPDGVGGGEPVTRERRHLYGSRR